ncbi:short-chain dehydrogenase/reductase [Saitoella complicata NRRL Y-17804]|uniref:NADPH-dependent 1-acyldihydroxyacetone phosphate reductase n=1 Tax=Saitoella complicata (strain BCRC 22490 / CBS 7301 / JCM 7358 / NBRC 10748 / NRRL Y-17804) TaxID=698492 RepID=A0A0E9NDL8_SAICN|nr:short-chain dehydrogenase/reductase [Saitoella complicata NRRL Y-17804]ODQ52555.1 short-chain dehydrogenase/reductase [Saitoella complicata NRRL Y-17804]GAO47500.1 hypothetical protein G7K_1706-t1 [Saitoella complicata NRRL Y-17804]
MAAKTVLITGCSKGGIGYALAKAFNAQGCKVYATARRLESMNGLSDLGIGTLKLDVNSAESVDKLKSIIEEKTGGTLDFLVNNAGIGYTTPLADVDIDQARNLFETNLISVMQMVKSFHKLLIASKGTIINIGSIGAFLPSPFGGVYNASKAALLSYGDALRIEMEPFDVHVQTIITGAIKSNIANNAAARYSLPSDSIFAPITSFVEARLNASQTNGPLDTDVYARDVVRQALFPPRSLWALGGRVRRPYYWRGGLSDITRFIRRFLPMNFWDFILAYKFGLNVLNRKLRDGKKDL